MSDEIPVGFSMPRKARPAQPLGRFLPDVVGDEFGYAAVTSTARVPWAAMTGSHACWWVMT